MNENTIFNISPWNILSEMIGSDRPFNDMFRTLASRVEGRFPPVNFYIGADKAVLDIEMPGRKPGDVDIQLEPQAVIIEGAKKEGPRGGQAFKRRIELPFPIDTDKAKATFKNGILRVEMPKSAEAVPKKIEIGADA